MLYAFGGGEIPVSVSAIPDGNDPLVHTVRAVGAVSTALAALRIGDTMGARGPYGVGPEYDAGPGRDVLIVAGGIGIAPLRPLVHAAARSHDPYQQAQEFARQVLANAMSPIREHYPDVTVEEVVVRSGRAGALVEAAEAAALVVLAAHRRAHPTGARLGPTTHAVLHHSPVPTLVVPVQP